MNVTVACVDALHLVILATADRTQASTSQTTQRLLCLVVLGLSMLLSLSCALGVWLIPKRRVGCSMVVNTLVFLLHALVFLPLGVVILVDGHRVLGLLELAFAVEMVAGRDKPVVVMDSYVYVTYSPSIIGVDIESTVGAKDEAKEAVCYRKTQPKMYAKARAVARLMIRTEREQPSQGSEKVTNWSFCTGWLIGRGNYLITNHHCMKDAAVVEQDRTEGVLSSVISRFWPNTRSPPDRAGRVVEAVVGFMAETKSCREPGFMGEKVGTVEATRVSVITENRALDYALLRVLTNDSATDLARRYGYLRLRAAGPVDGEAIYIPQHPRGEPKEIAATKDGKSAVIEVLPSNSIDSSGYLRGREPSDIQPIVWYNADTEPGSSGSPVLSRKDNTVVALHCAGNSETAQSASTELFNMGVRIDLIARDLQRRKFLPRNALAS
ncbi:hypothetical protein JG688_00005348 [Phytophthora aleatoria]|uniref:Serine protease n=1 Tax=Phytophthora aleatoria TaxID=2496075 RepID=A0A8J5MH03_9STRA|nr:hypothetical protein JG688_00005348 [Phytophthora aleatoria]